MEYNFEELNMAQMKLLLERYNGQQKSKKKYYEKNKTVINEYAKNYMVDRYKTDEEFREKQKAYARERSRITYEKKRIKKIINELQNDLVNQDFGELDITIQ